MLAVALALTTVGVLVGLFGVKLFRILMPLAGIVAGAAVGFVGFQGVFGTGFVSTTLAIFVALLLGILLGVLSFLFVHIALVVYTAILTASAAAYLGTALGVGDVAFVMWLLTVAGAIVGLVVANRQGFTGSVVVILTSFLGAALVLAGVFLMAGNFTLDQLNERGVGALMAETVSQSLLWLFVWLAGSLILAQVQYRLLQIESLESAYEYNFEQRK